MPQRVRGVRILKAVASPLRLQTINLLFDKGPLSYTELMSALKMSPSRDAGRFAYHLKFLLKADLVEADVEARKYILTDLGRMVIDVADRIDKKALRPKSLLVRTSTELSALRKGYQSVFWPILPDESPAAGEITVSCKVDLPDRGHADLSSPLRSP